MEPIAQTSVPAQGSITLAGFSVTPPEWAETSEIIAEQSLVGLILGVSLGSFEIPDSFYYLVCIRWTTGSGMVARYRLSQCDYDTVHAPDYQNQTVGGDSPTIEFWNTSESADPVVFAGGSITIGQWTEWLPQGILANT
jgi:hypothetical protein